MLLVYITFSCLVDLADSHIALIASMPKIQGSPHLIILPLSLVNDWGRELEIRLKPKRDVCIYRMYLQFEADICLNQLISNLDENKKGTSTTKYSLEELRSKDIVITTYDRIRIEGMLFETTKADFIAKQQDGSNYKTPVRGHYPLMLVFWHIIFLDEAHRIVNPKAAISRAANMLKAKAKVPMTGTPLQNEYRDIQSLMTFMHVKPWDQVDTFSRASALAPSLIIY